MIEKIPVAGGASGDFFHDERFNRFRRKSILLGSRAVDFPDPDDIEHQGPLVAAELEGDDAKRCIESYKISADSIRAAIEYTESLGKDEVNGFTSESAEKMRLAKKAYATALSHLPEVGKSTEKVDKKA